jgi:hypothetical protein
MSIKKQIFLFWISIYVFGCANSSNYIPANYAGDDAGYIVMSLGASTETKYEAYKLFIRKMDKSLNSGVAYLPDNMFKPTKKDFIDNDSHGAVISFAMPAGDYEIYNCDIFENLGLRQTNYRAKQDFSIPFSIKPGTATYLGEYIAFTIGKGFLGTSTGGAIFVVKNEMARDVQIAKKKFPDLFADNVIDSVPSPDSIGCPLIKGPRKNKITF